MGKIISRHKTFWSQKSAQFSLLFSLFLLVVSLLFNYAANIYTVNHISNRVSDIFLDNLPVVNVNFIFLDGSVLLILFVILLILHRPERMPFTLKSLALFIFVRSAFLIMTHLSPPLPQYPINEGDILQKITLGDDLFFSGHTGLPFLMALVFWDNRYLRAVFIATSAIFGASVLLGHLHYSIDVFAAFFITYGVFVIAQRFFKKDYKNLMLDRGDANG